MREAERCAREGERHTGMTLPGRRETDRARRDEGLGADRRPAARGVPETWRSARHERDHWCEARAQSQTDKHEDRDDEDIRRACGERGDDALVLVVRIAAAGVGCVIVRAHRMVVGARGTDRRLGMEKRVRRRIGREPGQQADQPHGQPRDGPPEVGRAAGRAGAVEA